MTCSACGHENRPEAKFCEQCGARVGRVCGTCCAELSPTAKFCSQCGQAVDTWNASALPRAAPTRRPTWTSALETPSVPSAVVHATQRTVLAADTASSAPELSPGSARETSRTWLDRVLAHTLNRCRACGSSDVRRSRIRPEERGAHGLRSPYRCEACQARYWVISRKAYATFVSGGLSVLIGVLLAIAISSPSPHPSVVAGGAPLGANEVIVPISGLPDQFESETHRLESLNAP